jgi:hypothetical protein
MFRISHKAALAAILASCALVIGGTGTATAATNADASAVTLVCDGVFRMQRASIEGTSEANFAGTMHVALVAEEDGVTAVRLQSFEDGERTPVQSYVTVPFEEPPATDEMAQLFPELLVDGPAEAEAEPVAVEFTATPGELTIDTTDREIVLRHVLESGPMMKARVDGRPLVSTREKIETVEMRLDRSSGDISLVWGEDSVRDHRRPGAIRVAKVCLRDEKSYQAVCMPVRQRAF